MNTLFLVCLSIFLIVNIAVAAVDRGRASSFRDYVNAGKNQKTGAVTMSLLATMIGASATIGVTNTVYNIGFPGIWWLLFGALGLVMQAVFLSERVRNTGADTLPELAGIMAGGGAETLLSLVIVVSWIGVIAGQFAALKSLIVFALGKESKTVFMIVAAVVILYTVLGGQLSVVRTDRIQLVIIVLGVAMACGFLYFAKGGNTAFHPELFNASYRPVNWFTQLFVIGGVYFMGPDILSRNFLSRDEKTAKRSAFLAGLLFTVFALVITLIGMWVRGNMTEEELGEKSALLAAIDMMPGWISVLILLALFAAVLSSTDTCIINASAIFVKNILKKDSIGLTRITVGGIGCLSMLLVMAGQGDIMDLLTGAYSVYTPGVIFPLLVAILAYQKRRIRKPVWFAAVAIGGLCGLLGNYFPNLLPGIGMPAFLTDNLTLIGMGGSLGMALLSLV